MDEQEFIATEGVRSDTVGRNLHDIREAIERGKSERIRAEREAQSSHFASLLNNGAGATVAGRGTPHVGEYRRQTAIDIALRIAQALSMDFKKYTGTGQSTFSPDEFLAFAAKVENYIEYGGMTEKAPSESS